MAKTGHDFPSATRMPLVIVEPFALHNNIVRCAMLSLDRFSLLAATADISVSVLLSPDNSDVELIPVRPRAYPDHLIEELRGTPRGSVLRFAGTLGLTGDVAHAQFAEPLPEHVVQALAESFASYVNEFRAGIEREQIRRMWELPDTRPEF